MEELSNHQRLLMEIRDKLCSGNAAQLAREIGKDPTYVNRLFYPKGKAGAKGIGLEIMAACSNAFYLPPGFWDKAAPALTSRQTEIIQFVRELRNRVAHGQAPEAEAEAFRRYDRAVRERSENVLRRLHELVRVHATQGAGDLQEELQGYTGDELSVPGPLPTGERPQAYGMEPILAWEHPDDLPEGEFVMIPRLDVHLSAGNGHDQVEIDLVKDNPQAFRSEWIRQMRLKPAKLAAMRASGDSMEPTIHDGDSLLVDTSQTTVVDGKVYALWYDGGERVKRLFRLPGGGLRIVSDNARFPTVEVPPGYNEHVRVIGRIVHRSGTGGL